MADETEPPVHVERLTPRDAFKDGDVLPVDDVPEAKNLRPVVPGFSRPPVEPRIFMAAAGHSALNVMPEAEIPTPPVETGTPEPEQPSEVVEDPYKELHEEQERILREESRKAGTKKSLNDALDASYREGRKEPVIFLHDGTEMTIMDFLDHHIFTYDDFNEEDRAAVIRKYKKYVEGYDVDRGWGPSKRKTKRKREYPRTSVPPGFVDNKSLAAGEREEDHSLDPEI